MLVTERAATLAPMTDEAIESRGGAIRRRMEALGMGVSDLAQEAGISRGQVYRVFRDEENLREQSYTACEPPSSAATLSRPDSEASSIIRP
jgi:AcrR family transcriptional regulator